MKKLLLFCAFLLCIGFGFFLSQFSAQHNNPSYTLYFQGNTFENHLIDSGFACNGGKIYQNDKILIDDIELTNSRKLCATSMYEGTDDAAIFFHFCYANGNSGECEALVMSYNPNKSEWIYIARGIISEIGSAPSLGQILQLGELYEQNAKNNNIPSSEGYQSLRAYFQNQWNVNIPE